MQSQYFQLMLEIFRLYEELALSWFGKTDSETKCDGTTITELDRRASDMIIKMLNKHLPEHGVLSEENTEIFNPQADFQWVVDPVDGTASFVRGFKSWGLGIGLLHRGEPLEGFMCFPALRENFFSNNAGIWLNAQPCKPIRDTKPDNRNCLTDSSIHQLYSVGALQEYKLRNFGSNLYHMACVGLGRSEVMITGLVGIWDLAAALPLIRSQGMVEKHPDGKLLNIADLLSPTNNFRVSQPLLIGSPQQVEHVRNLLQPLRAS